MSQGVTHTGVVVAADGRNVKVRMDDGNAAGCAACSLHSLCSPLGKNDDSVIILARAHDSLIVNEGERVIVGIGDGAQWRAVAVAFGGAKGGPLAIAFSLPCLLMLTVVVAGRFLGFGDDISALSALIATVVYFGMLYIFRSRLRVSYRWKVIGKA